jgi:hypothetical protein
MIAIPTVSSASIAARSTESSMPNMAAPGGLAAAARRPSGRAVLCGDVCGVAVARVDRADKATLVVDVAVGRLIPEVGAVPRRGVLGDCGLASATTGSAAPSAAAGEGVLDGTGGGTDGGAAAGRDR